MNIKLTKHMLLTMEEPDASVVTTVENQQLARELRERLPAAAADISISELALARQRHESWEKRFGEVVRGWRQERNWSQEDVVEKLRHEGFEMHQTTIAKIERGTRPLRVAEASALATVFRMPIMAVFELSLPEDQPADIQERQDQLEEARKAADSAREQLYSVAERHAHLLDRVEKLVLRMNEEAADKEGGRGGSEA